MNVLVAQFVTESNEHIPQMTTLDSYDLRFGADATSQMNMGSVFEDAGVGVIQSVYANGFSGGVVERCAFDYIEGRILADVREHIQEIDGMFLHLHGASEVEGIGSGDHHILHAIRDIVGPYLPIVVACDPHGNLCKSYVYDATVIRSYRESPHTDLADTVKRCCSILVDLLNHRQNIRPAYRKLPLILGGEQSVSADEPVRSINAYMDEMEQDPRVLSASWHVGYIRHDTDVAGCGVVVVPATEADQGYAEEKADELAAYVWDRRHVFHYTGLTQEPGEALSTACSCLTGTAFLTDSGDNVTSGAMGANTLVLRQVLASKEAVGKKVLFGGITDAKTAAQIAFANIGDRMHISLGAGYDELSAPVELDIQIRSRGRLEGFMGYMGDYGEGEVVSVEGADGPSIDIIVLPYGHTMVELHQFASLGVECSDYDLVVVKQGYIFPELKELAERSGALSVMSLTEGATYQNTAKLPLKRIMRPMFPIDDM
ncbi:M81 family metallopeptidase [Collinsella sp. An2]|uniref:M81 family metallopeptidase n=1 Tax=Collinsella sp. An2 TaxID=1965585 RepID=UPI000B3AB5C6|nr:M81 family metallopeptidase [Collinsella sp. An2]OUP10909.1 microcystin degradation protein MlrC [Collinsella sp. An2]